MKISEIVKKLDMSIQNEAKIDFIMFSYEYKLSQELDYTLRNMSSYRLKAFWLSKSKSEDVYAGTKIYFLDGFPVCISSTKGKKWRENFSWFNEDSYVKTRNYILSVIIPYVGYTSIENDIGDNFNVSNTENVLDWSNIKFKNKRVKIVDYTTNDYVTIELENGQQITVGVHQLSFKFNIKE